MNIAQQKTFAHKDHGTTLPLTANFGNLAGEMSPLCVPMPVLNMAPTPAKLVTQPGTCPTPRAMQSASSDTRGFRNLRLVLPGCGHWSQVHAAPNDRNHCIRAAEKWQQLCRSKSYSAPFHFLARSFMSLSAQALDGLHLHAATTRREHAQI